MTEAIFQLEQEQVEQQVDADLAGLSSAEAERRLREFGTNSIRSDTKVSAWQIFLNQITSPMIYVLVAALVITLVIQSYADATVIALVLLVNATIGFIQEYKAESAVQSLMELVAPKATVRRDGEQQRVAAEQLVPGDVVFLQAGEVVPADVRLTRSDSLQINEAALTGESVPVDKRDQPLDELAADAPPAEQANMAFMGTAITSGGGQGFVVATGERTELGKIAEQIRGGQDVQTPLQQRMDRLAKWIAVIILAVAAGAFAVGIAMGRSIAEMFLLAVSLSVAAIPAGLPVVMTVALAVGVRRMARRHAVIRNLPAVETLGSCNVIVSDKTGTLTQNRMRAQRVLTEEHDLDLERDPGPEGQCDPDSIRADEDIEDAGPHCLTLLCGALCNNAEWNPREQDQDASVASGTDEHRQQEPGHEWGTGARAGDADATTDGPNSENADLGGDRAEGDPMEVALLRSAERAGLPRGDLISRFPRRDEIPFRTEQRFSATIHEDANGNGPVVWIKGAPERVFQMCASVLAESGERQSIDRDQLADWNDRLARSGLRVLAMAFGRGDEAVESIRGENPEGFLFLGMVGFSDPPRPEAVQAVDKCHQAGIRIIMVTGDHARTAASIAEQVHLDRKPAFSAPGNNRLAARDSAGEQESSVLEARSGQEIEGLSDEQLDRLLSETNVFARVEPDHKVRIVNRLKAKDWIIAVTGDGVNDAPALKNAHLGSAMGQAGTDVAKEASDMVITDDNFASVYAAVEEGRTAFRNIRMATFFLLSTGAADVLIILASLALRWPLPLLPAQILWCNVVTNGIADVALGFEKGEPGLYRRPPRPISEGILDANLIERLVLVGIWLTVGTLGVFYWVVQADGGVDLARVSALTTLVLFQKVHVFNCRSEGRSIFKTPLLGNKVLFAGVMVSLVLHIAALYIPWTQRLLAFEPLPWQVWLAAAGVASTAIVVNELHKWLRPKDYGEPADHEEPSHDLQSPADTASGNAS